MLRLRSLANKYKKRTLRPKYTHTQGTPYAATLDSGFVRTGGQLTGTPTSGITGNTQAAILPGAVLIKGVGETVTLASATTTQRAFGLCANFVGGTMDEIGDGSDVGVWRGVGSTYQVLAPAFDDTGLAAAAAADTGAVDKEVYLKSNAKGQLTVVTPATPSAAADYTGRTARLIKQIGATGIEIELLV